MPLLQNNLGVSITVKIILYNKSGKYQRISVISVIEHPFNLCAYSSPLFCPPSVG